MSHFSPPVPMVEGWAGDPKQEARGATEAAAGGAAEEGVAARGGP